MNQLNKTALQQVSGGMAKVPPPPPPPPPPEPKTNYGPYGGLGL